MLMRLFLLLTLVPLVELALLIWIGGKTNWQTAVLLAVLPGVLGAWLIRGAGLRCVRAIRVQLGHGQLPANALVDAVFILVAGVLLLTPGVLTDLVGLLLLIPWTRNLLRRLLWVRVSAKFAFWTGGDQPGDRIIDVQLKKPRDAP